METQIIFICLFLGFAFSVADKVTKRVGETVTLHPNRTTESLNNFLWTFGPNAPVEVIAIVTNREVTKVNGTRFGNRLQTAAHDGSITIYNLTANDGGIFYIQILTESGILNRTIHLIVQVYDELKNVVEGGNVTLETNMEKLETMYRVNWRQGEGIKGKLIAQWKYSYITIEESFKDILQLNPLNGYLTFTRIIREHSGLYNVQILEGEQLHSTKCYNVTVYEPVSVPYFTTNITEIFEFRTLPSDTEMFEFGASPSVMTCYVACFVKNGPDVNLTWFNGPTIISSINKSMNVSMTLSLPLKIQQENKENFTCEARNPVTVERKTLSPTIWCPSHDPDWSDTRKPVTMFLLVVLVVVSVIVIFLLIGIMVKCRRKLSCMRNGIELSPVQNSEDPLPLGSESDSLQQN